MPDRLPILVLGGSDPRPGPVPKGMQRSDMLAGCKGALLLPNGRCLADELVARIRGSERFEEPRLVGPRRIYDSLTDCPLVDVEGHLAVTLNAVREELNRLPDPSQPVAFTTCDILPSSDDLRELIDSSYAPHRETCLWGQLVTSEPAEMGASAWKPAYGFGESAGAAPRTMYPGHLLIARPAAIRIRLMNHLLQLAYRHRNLQIGRRPIPMIMKGIGRLMRADFDNLRHGQFPLLTFSIPWNCLTAFLKFQRRRLSVPEFAHAVMRVFVHRDYQQTDPPSVVFSTTHLRAFAKDIDTKAELDESLPSIP